jgi:hypothetical protein
LQLLLLHVAGQGAIFNGEDSTVRLSDTIVHFLYLSVPCLLSQFCSSGTQPARRAHSLLRKQLARSELRPRAQSQHPAMQQEVLFFCVALGYHCECSMDTTVCNTPSASVLWSLYWT